MTTAERTLIETRRRYEAALIRGRRLLERDEREYAQLCTQLARAQVELRTYLLPAA